MAIKHQLTTIYEQTLYGLRDLGFLTQNDIKQATGIIHEAMIRNKGKNKDSLEAKELSQKSVVDEMKDLSMDSPKTGYKVGIPELKGGSDEN